MRSVSKVMFIFKSVTKVNYLYLNLLQKETTKVMLQEETLQEETRIVINCQDEPFGCSVFIKGYNRQSEETH